MIPDHGLRLRLHPDPVLRERARPIDAVDATVRELAAAMVEIMRAHDGIGLAGPQVGVSRRIFVCDVPPFDDDGESEPASETAEHTDGPLVCINPEFEPLPDAERSGFDEGCLSLPGIRGEILRPETVRLTATDTKGQRFTLDCGGLLARCVQHEHDHLEGVMIIDKMNQMARLKNRRKIRELEADA